jgi:23S rRNA (cytidine1920-2'-O)/16S rRNA (cytidine1409-2'-O)-methyltransferase
VSQRLDQLLCERGLFTSRERAQRAIMAGEVFVAGQRLDKPGVKVDAEAEVELRATRPRFVSRGGEKLAGALEDLVIDVSGRICLDVGASTGGFTDCLLQRGAQRVFAVDVGYGQLDAGLRSDPRVVVQERLNARFLARHDFPEPFDLATIDVSFISLRLVVPSTIGLLRPRGEVLCLVKPQFEVGRKAVGRGGVVRDEAVRRGVILERIADFEALGLELLGWVDSRLAGPAGNLEAFVHLRLADGAPLAGANAP